MKVDLYTRVILTIIAGALLYLCWTSSTPVVKAQDEIQKVFITNDKPIPITAEPYHVWISTGDGQPLPVKIVSETKPQGKN